MEIRGRRRFRDSVTLYERLTIPVLLSQQPHATLSGLDSMGLVRIKGDHCFSSHPVSFCTTEINTEIELGDQSTDKGLIEKGRII